MPRPPPEPIFTEPVVLPTLRLPELTKLALDDLELEVQDELASNSHIKQQVRNLLPSGLLLAAAMLWARSIMSASRTNALHVLGH